MTLCSGEVDATNLTIKNLTDPRNIKYPGIKIANSRSPLCLGNHTDVNLLAIVPKKAEENLSQVIDEKSNIFPLSLKMRDQ